MTVYRRYPDVDAVLRDLMTREFGHAMTEIAARVDGEDGRRRVVGRVLAIVDALGAHPLMKKVVDAEPELLLPYVLGRMGETQRTAVALAARDIAAGQADGSIRAGDPRVLAQALLLITQSFVLSGAIAEDVSAAALREELAHVLDAALSS
jgi:AcrR family transcriptional regulator